MNNGIPLKDQLLTLYYRQGWKGFSRIWSSLKRIGNHPCLQFKNKYGANLYLNPENYIDSHVLRLGYYESEVLEAILPFLGDDSVLWDIGANFGLHGITAKLLKPESRVICIEPFPLMMAQLQANCLLNNIKIEMVNIALSHSPNFQVLHVIEAGNPGMSTLKPWTEADYSKKILCWCDTGDNLLLNHLLPQPTVIKIDVEGSEFEVLKGLVTTIKNPLLKAIIFEENSELLIKKQENHVYKLLVKEGFTIESLRRCEPTHHLLNNFIARRF